MNARLVVASHASLFSSGKLSKRRRFLHAGSVAATKDRFVGSLFSQLTIPEASPYDTANLKVLYPATANFGLVCRNPTEGSFPVVLFFPPSAIESHRYEWLGEELVLNAGVVFVSYDHMDQFDEESLFLTPYFFQNGTQIPPSSTILSLLKKLSELNNTGALAGKLDLERVVIGGHSLGGQFALFGADSEILPSLKGVFTYGSPSTDVGPNRPPTRSIYPLPGTVPHLWIEGSRDGFVQTERSPNATTLDNDTIPVSKAFLEGLFSGRAACYVELDGANHMDIANPVDLSSPNIALDFDSRMEKRQVEHVLAQIITAFVQNRLSDDTSAFQDYQSVLSLHDELLSNVVCNT